MRVICCAIIGGIMLMMTTVSACAQTPNLMPFHEWLAQMKIEAVQAGIGETTVNLALTNLKPLERVQTERKQQAEFTQTFAQYLANMLPASRINQAKALKAQHAALLSQVETSMNVDANVIVALWGIESSFGQRQGDLPIIAALATLAHDSNRPDFFKQELLQALRILDQGHITLADMKGSWAGAMGQSQFMPTSFLTYAVDFDGDGHKNIWQSTPDVFASIANYLKTSGWQYKQPLAVAAQVPFTPDEKELGRTVKKTVAAWRAQGVVHHDARVRDDMMASLVRVDAQQPDRYYLTFSNYDVIMKWNRSLFFATTVSYFADQLD